MPSTEKINLIPIETEMRRSYIKYAMSVIVGRALPDVRDGLKPVQRRILYAMKELNLTSKNQHRKSARVTGECLGKFHPHGDMAVYDALARMAQDFTMRYPLVDGQGNFGSIDGDEPAAMRYTEVRLARLAEEMLAELDEDTVDWMPNFDDSLQEPVVLPCRFPDLLVNGASGIAVGMSCSIPPHNLGEVIDATLRLIDHPNTEVEDLLNFIRGPDFPTGGIISDATSLVQAYKLGRGSIQILARINEETVKGERKRLVISEFPYQVNKAKILEHIADLIKEDRIEGIANARDESNREGIRVILDLKTGVQPAIVKKQLYRLTQLRSSFSYINLLLSNGRPQILDLKQTLQAFIGHRITVIERRTKHRLENVKERLNTLEGYIIAHRNLDRVLEIIRASQNLEEIKQKLSQIKLNDKQIEAVLQMRLQQLTRMEIDKIQREAEELRLQIENLNRILTERPRLLETLKNELTQIKNTYGDERRTEIRLEKLSLDIEETIKDEEALIFLSADGYVKRLTSKAFQVLGRGSKGIRSIELKDIDRLIRVIKSRTLETLIFLTNLGRAYALKAYEVPETGRTARGEPLVNLLQLTQGERVVTGVTVRDFTPNRYLTLVTKLGIVKRTKLDAFSNIRSNGVQAAQLNGEDNLVEAFITSGEDEIFMASSGGLAIHFKETKIPIMGRTARGVVGIRLSNGSTVTGASLIQSKATSKDLVLLSKGGYGKRTPIGKFRVQNRGGRGIQAMKINAKTDSLLAAQTVTETDDLLVTSETGQTVRLNVQSIPQQGRASSGVRIMRLNEGDRAASMVALKPDGT